MDSESLTVLCVDDDESFVTLTATHLERTGPGFTVFTETNPTDGLDRLADGTIDCIVSDHDMPQMTGLEFLETIRADHQDLPFILFTGKGSEDIAEQAINAGVTCYLQKEHDDSQFTVLANRIENAVSQYRAERRASTLKQEYELIAETATDAFWTVNPMTGKLTVSRGFEQFGYASDAAFDLEWFYEKLHPDDRKHVRQHDEAVFARNHDAFEELSDDRGQFVIEYRFEQADGAYAECLERGILLFEDGEPTKMVGTITDITERKERERELEHKTERLYKFASILSHDIRNPLSIAQGYLEMAQDECEAPHLDKVAEALGRVDSITEDVLTLAGDGDDITATDEVSLEAVAETAWKNIARQSAALETVAASVTIMCDSNRVCRALENLFRNAIEHGGDNVTVRVGPLEERDGFYVEDDGVGFSADTDQLFEWRYTTSEGGTGFGLAIVEQIVTAHGWTITATDSDVGGARFEIQCDALS